MMMRLLKMSMILGLGLLVWSPLEAMYSGCPTQTESVDMPEVIDTLIVCLKKMNVVFLIVAECEAANYDYQSTDLQAVQKVFETGSRAVEGISLQCKNIVDQIPLHQRKSIEAILTQINNDGLAKVQAPDVSEYR